LKEWCRGHRSRLAHASLQRRYRLEWESLLAALF
jgi:hypothetical protein